MTGTNLNAMLQAYDYAVILSASKVDDGSVYDMPLRNKIRTHDRVQGAVIEQWVNAMRAKADLNVSTTKLLDSIAKLLSAAKSNPIISGQEDIEDGDVDFDELLNKKVEE